MYVISGDLALNRGRIIQPYAGWTCAFLCGVRLHLAASLSETASDVLSGFVLADVSLDTYL